MINLPRVLVVSGEPFNAESATGITLSNLFRGWPRSLLSQIYTSNVLADFSLCENYWRLSTRNLVGINILLKSSDLRLLKPDARVMSKSGDIKHDSHVSQIIKTLRRYSQWLDWLPYRVPEQSLAEIRDFEPEVIYATLGSMRMVRLVASLSSQLGVPVVPHFLDDWLSTYDSSGSRSLMAGVARPRLEAETRRLLKQAPFAMAISDSMSSEYSRSFTIPFETFVNPPDTPVGCPRTYVFEVSERLWKLVYTGGLHLGRSDVLHAVASAVDRLARQGHKIELSIYVPQKDIALANVAFDGLLGVVVHGNIPAEHISGILDDSDLAVHVESFQSGFKKYTRLSVSTKIPQYLASGLPVFACCPNDVASGQYIDKHNCGVVIGEESIDALESTLHSLLDQPVRMRSLSANAIRVASERHDGEIERLRFKEALRRAAGIGPDVAI